VSELNLPHVSYERVQRSAGRPATKTPTDSCGLRRFSSPSQAQWGQVTAPGAIPHFLAARIGFRPTSNRGVARMRLRWLEPCRESVSQLRPDTKSAVNLMSRGADRATPAAIASATGGRSPRPGGVHIANWRFI